MTDTAAFFSVSHEDGIAHVELDRPERMNTMTPAFFPALRDLVRRLSDEGATRAMVLSSTGKHFSAGMSLEVFAGDGLALAVGTARERLSFQESLRKLIDCFSALDEARFPIVCAIQGGCIGGALDLATACDLRVCSADAFFTVQETSIGMAADLGVLQRLAEDRAACRRARDGLHRRAARRRARARRRPGECGAARCRRAVARAFALARTIAAKSPLAIAGTKLAINHARDHSTAAALQQMTLLQSAIFDNAEMATAIAAWKEKRGAEFDPLAPVAPV